MAAMTRRAVSAQRRRDLYEQRIAAGQGVLPQLGQAWRWVLAECRHLSKPRRWTPTGRPVSAVLDEALAAMTDLARRLNEEGWR